MKNRLSDERDGRYPPTNNQIKYLGIPLIVALFNGMLAQASPISPDTIKHSEAAENLAAWEAERAQVKTELVVETFGLAEDAIKADTHTKVLTAADFLNPENSLSKANDKTPRKFEGDPIKTQQEALQVISKAQELAENLKGLEGEALTAKMAEMGITLDSIIAMLDELEDARQFFVTMDPGEPNSSSTSVENSEHAYCVGKQDVIRKINNILEPLAFKLKKQAAAKEMAELDQNFAKNGKTLDQITKGSQLDKAFKALGMKVYEKKDRRGYNNVYVEINGEEIKVVGGRTFGEYLIVSRKNGEVQIITFKMIVKEGKDNAGDIFYTEFRENPAKNLVEEWGKQYSEFSKDAEYNLNPIIDNSNENNAVGYNR